MGAVERVEAKRRIWRWFVGTQDPAQFIFVDESGADITLVPAYGRAPRGERSRGSQPRGTHRHLTLFAALSVQGMGPAMVMDGAADAAAFHTYLNRVLVPSLRPGQIVIMDNLSVHKQARFREAIEAAGCRLLFLPTYSPDLNPIEQAFAKLKALLRKAQARTTEALQDAIARALGAVTTNDAQGFFRGCGYVPL